VSDSEFDFIRDIFAPLTDNASGAYGLMDDAALIDEGAIVVTKDMMIAGVHFLPKDPLDLVARKLIRVNLSDLAAKGVKPVGYFLGCAWPGKTSRAKLEQFADGLREDQDFFKISLFGGDTTVHAVKSAPLTLSATFFGTPPRHGMTLRGGAQPGDDLYVSGAIGDAGLGLAALRREGKFPAADKAPLIHRYQLPAPRISLGAALSNIATAAIDVSDGLIADAGHLARGAGLGVVINAVLMPLSSPARRWVAAQADNDQALGALAGFGDDYELLFTAPNTMRRSVSVAANASRTEVTRIGAVKRGEGVAFMNANGEPIKITAKGFDHFASR